MNLISITWDVVPHIFKAGGFEVRWYGVLFALGFMIAYLILSKVFKNEGLSIDTLDKLTMYVFIGTVLGARLGHCLFYEPEYYLANPLSILKIWEGGLASHGAAVGIFLALWLFSIIQKTPFDWLLARVTMTIPLTGACIRIGNLMNSEIYGKETNLPWAFDFVRDNAMHRHPTQIYEALAYIAIFFILYFVYKKQGKQTNNWQLFGMFLVLLFSARFFLEMLKEVQVDFEKSMALNMGQLLSIPFILAGVWLMFKQKK